MSIFGVAHPVRPPGDVAFEALLDHLGAEAACLQRVALSLAEEAVALRRMDRDAIEASARAKLRACRAHARLAEERVDRLRAVCPKSNPQTLSALLESIGSDNVASTQLECLHALRTRLRAELTKIDRLQRLNVASAESGLAAVRGARRVISRMGAGQTTTYSRAGAITTPRGGVLLNRRG